MKIIDAVIIVMVLITIIISIVSLSRLNSSKEKYMSALLTADGPVLENSISKQCNSAIQFRHTPEEQIDNQGMKVGNILKNCNESCTCNGGKSCIGKNDPSSVAGSTYDSGSC